MKIITAPKRTVDEVLAGSAGRRWRVTIKGGPHDGVVLPVVEGSFSIDQSADVRRSGSLTIAGMPEWEPRDASDALDVRSRAELILEAGIVDDDDVTHWWPQGVFRCTQVHVEASATGISLGVTIADRASAVKMAGIDRRWSASATDGILRSVIGVIQYVSPGTTVDVDLSDDLRFGADVVLAEAGDDPWPKCVALVASLGRELYFDATGHLVAPLRIDPLLTDPTPILGMTARSIAMDASSIVNTVICPWEEVAPGDAPEGWKPAGGVEKAVDSTTSTRVDVMGQIVRKVQSDTSVIHTADHARLAAQSDLALRMGLAKSATGTAVHDPRLDVGVPVIVDYDRYVLTKMDVNLADGSCTLDFGASTPDIVQAISRALRPPAEYQTREIVTGLSPVMVRLATEPFGSSIAVEWTDALKGVAVGDPITVLHKGAGKHVGVALLVTKPIEKVYAGDSLGSIGGADISVGEDTPLSVSVAGEGTYAFNNGTATLPERSGSWGQLGLSRTSGSVVGYFDPNAPTPFDGKSSDPVNIGYVNSNRWWIQDTRSKLSNLNSAMGNIIYTLNRVVDELNSSHDLS